MTDESLIRVVSEKKILFVATKNLDYLRNVQEIELLRKYSAQTDIIAFLSKSYFMRLFLVWFSLLRTRITEYDLVFIGFAPQLVLPFFHKLQKKTVIEDFFISLYDTFVQDRKKFSQRSIAARMLKKLDERTLALGDIIISDTMAHAEYFASDLNCDRRKIKVLYLEADKSIYYPRPVLHHSESPFHVLYFGSILPLQGIDVVLDAIRSFRDDSEFSFEVIGPLKSGSIPEQDNLVCIPWLSQQELAEHIACADLCLAGHFSGTIDKAKRTIPGKAYIYRAMEKPMVLGDTPANHELFEENKMTFFTPTGNPTALSETIRYAKTMLS